MKIVVDKEIPHLDNLFKEHDLIRLPGREITRDALMHADGLLVRSVTTVNDALLHQTPIKWVGSLTAGIDHLAIDWLTKQGIAWQACPGFNAPPVADWVMAVLSAIALQHTGKIPSKAAVVGVGQVGLRVAERLTLLGCDVQLVDPLRFENEVDFPHVPLQAISNVDLICLHTPLTKSVPHATYHLMNGEFMQQLRPGCILINAARGAVIDTNALLTHGKHLMACLDVFENEPHINLAVLKAAHVVSPHIAGHSIESKYRGVKMLYQWLLDKQFIKEINALPHETPLLYSLSTKQKTWYDVINGIFNVTAMSNELRDACIKSPNVSHTFDQIRKKYGNRHEFSNCRLENTAHLAEKDRMILRQCGFLMQ